MARLKVGIAVRPGHRPVEVGHLALDAGQERLRDIVLVGALRSLVGLDAAADEAVHALAEHGVTHALRQESVVGEDLERLELRAGGNCHEFGVRVRVAALREEVETATEVVIEAAEALLGLDHAGQRRAEGDRGIGAAHVEVRRASSRAQVGAVGTKGGHGAAREGGLERKEVERKWDRLPGGVAARIDQRPIGAICEADVECRCVRIQRAGAGSARPRRVRSNVDPAAGIIAAERTLAVVRNARLFEIIKAAFEVQPVVGEALADC